MGLSIISSNTTIKNTVMARGTVTTNGSQQTLFQTAAKTNYKINYLMFSVSPNTIRPVILFDNSSAPEINSINFQVSANGVTFIQFDPPLELSEGQGLRLNGDSAGAYNANWTVIGTATINTP